MVVCPSIDWSSSPMTLMRTKVLLNMDDANLVYKKGSTAGMSQVEAVWRRHFGYCTIKLCLLSTVFVCWWNVARVDLGSSLGALSPCTTAPPSMHVEYKRHGTVCWHVAAGAAHVSPMWSLAPDPPLRNPTYALRSCNRFSHELMSRRWNGKKNRV